METGDAEPWLCSHRKPCGLNSEHHPPEFSITQKTHIQTGHGENFSVFLLSSLNLQRKKK